MADHGLSLDTETYLITRGLATPPLVCGSVAWMGQDRLISGLLLDKQTTLEVFAQALDDPNQVLIGANIGGFDCGVLGVQFARLGLDALPAIFQAFEDGRVYDLQVAEALHAIANGHLGKDPRTGGPLKNPETGKPGSYSLSMCVDLVLGRQDAKQNDEYRLRYGELDAIPIEQWPEEARVYPVDDAKNTHEVALAQVGHIPRVTYQHNWGNVRFQTETGEWRVASQCLDCGTTRMSAPCTVRRPSDNLHEVANQTYSAFCLQLGATWGLHVDQSAVDVVERYALRRRANLIQPFIDAGIIRADGTEDRNVLKRMIAVAHGAKDPCPRCAGTGKVPSQKQNTLQCPACKGRCQPWKSGGKIKPPTVSSCETCNSTGRVPHPVINYINCVGEDFETKTCDGTGLVLTDDVPRSEKEGISFGRDTCHESGDEFLMSFGDFKDDEKWLKDYLPYLREARVQDPITGEWRDVALTLKPNAVLETGRVSYRGYIQLFPRAPGFIDKQTGEYIPSLRECITARGPSYEVVEVPDDYVLQPGEELIAA